jgi:trigger factor
VKSTVEQLSPTRVKINVEVPFDELKPDFDRAYKKIAQQVQIPGFRPGKAPARVLEQRLGRSVVLEEVVSEAVPAKYAEAVSSGEVHPLGRPEIEVTKLEDGDLLAFTAEVDVRPNIVLPPLSELAVSVDEITVTDAEVDEQLDGLRSRFGTFHAVQRPVQQGDFVVLDLTGTIDGKPVKELATKELSYEVGSGELFKGVDEALIGATRGDQRVVSTMLAAGEHAGREAEVTITIREVRERELPAADDEFAQLASEFDTLEELRADMRKRLTRVKAMQQATQARDKLLKALLATTEVPLPPAVVEAEFELRKHDALHAFNHDQGRFEQWLKLRGRTAEEFEADLRKGARETVKTQLLLDAIADAENLSVTDAELGERLVYQAQRYGISPNEYAQKAHKSGELGALYADVRRGKALVSVLRQATVTDTAGKPVDIEALLDAAHPTPPTVPVAQS